MKFCFNELKVTSFFTCNCIFCSLYNNYFGWHRILHKMMCPKTVINLELPGGGGCCSGGVRSVNLLGWCTTCTNKFTLFYIPLISDAVDTLLCFVRLDGIELTALFIRYVNTTCTAQQYLIKYLCYACNN